MVRFQSLPWLDTCDTFLELLHASTAYFQCQHQTMGTSDLNQIALLSLTSGNISTASSPA